MGGLESGGSSSGSRFLAAEACYGLDLAALRRAGYFVPGREASGSWSWWTNNNPDPSATVAVAIDLRELEAPTFTITYAAGEEPTVIRGELLRPPTKARPLDSPKVAGGTLVACSRQMILNRPPSRRAARPRSWPAMRLRSHTGTSASCRPVTKAHTAV